MGIEMQQAGPLLEHIQKNHLSKDWHLYLSHSKDQSGYDVILEAVLPVEIPVGRKDPGEEFFQMVKHALLDTTLVKNHELTIENSMDRRLVEKEKEIKTLRDDYERQIEELVEQVKEFKPYYDHYRLQYQTLHGKNIPPIQS